MNHLNQKQAYGFAAAVVVGAVIGITAFGNSKPLKNPFDIASTPYVAFIIS